MSDTNDTTQKTEMKLQLRIEDGKTYDIKIECRDHTLEDMIEVFRISVQRIIQHVRAGIKPESFTHSLGADHSVSLEVIEWPDTPKPIRNWPLENGSP